MVYLDYNATTPLADEALQAMLPYLTERYGNPSSVHAAGRCSRAAVDDARDCLASLLGVRPHEIVFTSGGTESNNLAIIGLALAHANISPPPRPRRHLITCTTEHHAVLHAFQTLCDQERFELTLLPVDSFGRVDPEHLRSALREDTLLVSIMSANNETGTLQPIADLALLCQERGVLLHSDMVQSFGKEKIAPHSLGVDALSLAAHKFYGPLGAGALFLRAGIPLAPLHHGGFHENQRRPGTENVPAIVGLAAAAQLAYSRREEEQTRLWELREMLWELIHQALPQAIRNGHPQQCLANTLNVSFPGADGESLLIALDLEGICASSGSACMVGSVLPSHVLQAMGVAPPLARSTIRFSLGKGTSKEEIQTTASALLRVLERLQAAT